LRDNQPRYKNNFREIFRSIFKNAVERKWLPKEHSFTELLRNEPTVDKAKTIITPEQFRRMLLACNEQMLPVIALRGFCGIRREEALRLGWVDIWSREGYVEIPAEKAKTKKRRLIPRFAALEAWLDPYRNMDGRLWKQSNNVFGHAQNDLYKQVGVSGDNVLRDAFATYRMAGLQNEAQVAHEMGNSPRMVFKSYRELATPAEAERWFGIMPMQQNKSIIQLSNEKIKR
jgi:integrase